MLTHLEFMDSNVGAPGCRALGDALMMGANRSLLTLRLDNNPAVSNEGVTELCMGLRTNKYLKVSNTAADRCCGVAQCAVPPRARGSRGLALEHIAVNFVFAAVWWRRAWLRPHRCCCGWHCCCCCVAEADAVVLRRRAGGLNRVGRGVVVPGVRAWAFRSNGRVAVQCPGVSRIARGFGGVTGVVFVPWRLAGQSHWLRWAASDCPSIAG